MNKLADYIKELREQSGYTQQQVANALCIGRSTYSNYENGHRLPDINVLSRLAAFYDIHLDSFSFETHTYAGVLREQPTQKPTKNHMDALILNLDEVELIEEYRTLEMHKRDLILPYLRTLKAQNV